MRQTTTGALLTLLAAGTLAASAQTPSDTLRGKAIGEVVVTGSNNAVNRNLLPYTVTVVSSSQLEATGETQLLTALSGRVPSMFVSERNIFGFGVSTGGSGGIKIRGVGSSPTSQILMMVDGQPQFAGIYSHHVADFYASEYVDRVEVLRGPGSVLYGSNAMGGVVNVITKSATRDGARTTLTSEYGSYNTWKTSLTNTLRYGKFSSLISLGYDRTDGTVDKFDFKQGNLYVKAAYDFSDRWKAAADYSLTGFSGNDPIYPTLSDPASTSVYHQNITRGEASLSLHNRCKATNGSVRVYYSYGNHFIDDPRHFHSLDDRFGILAYQNFTPWKAASATVGFDFDTYTGRIPMSGGTAHTEGSKSTMSRKSVTEYSPYVTLSQNLLGETLTLSAGLRMANSDRFGTRWIPQGGVVARPGDGWTLKASVAKGYRNPSFRELYLYRTANSDLDPESMTNYEVTAGKYFSRYLDVDVTAYFSEGDNLIQVKDSRNANTGSFINKGVEVSASSLPLDNLSLRTSYSYMHTSVKDLTAAPKNQCYLGVGWSVIPKLKVDAELRTVGNLFVSEGMARQNYALLDIKLTFSVDKRLKLFAKLDNVTDTRYTINRGYEMPGFTAMGGFKLTL